MNESPLPEAQRWTGTHMYKYGANVTWLEPLIVHHVLHIATANEMNDPNDSRPKVRYLNRRELVRFMTKFKVRSEPALAAVRPELNAHIGTLCSTLNSDDLFRWTVEQMDADLLIRRVYSMTTRWNNLKMWAQYGNDHKGYCLEFANDPDDRVFGMARMVIYDDSFSLDLTREDHITPVWYLFKHPDWRCEEEVRIVLPSAFGGPKFTLPPHLLTRIILGRHMPPSDVKRVRQWATRRTPPLDVAVTTYDAITRTFALV